MKRYAWLLIATMTLPAVARESALTVDRSSLPPNWHLRDASEFAKLGMPAQTLVYQTAKNQPSRATVFVESRVIAKRMPERAEAWTKLLIPTPPSSSWSMTPPVIVERAGLRIWRSDLITDTDVVQHHIRMQAIEHDGSVLVMAFEQTRSTYERDLPLVQILFDRVLPARVR